MKKPTQKEKAIIIVEAIVASFLMVFAFAAATQLFNAALQWESQGTNVRRASMVAQKKMDELRAWSENFHRSNPFDQGWATQTGLRPAYPEAPGFAVTVIAEPAVYLTPNPLRPADALPPDGFHSPTSNLYVPPPVPTAPNPTPNPQKHDLWWTYPYSRTMNDSMYRVEVTVNYASDGNGDGLGDREFKLMSVIGDPIAPLRNTGAGAFPNEPVSITGPNQLSNPGDSGDYNVNIHLPSGASVPDVTVLWTVDPSSTGALELLPSDSSGRLVTATRSALTPAGAAATAWLAAKIRYRGKEVVGYFEVDLP